MSARWASMLRWSISTPTISPAWRLGKKQRRDCCNFKNKCAKNSWLAPGKPRKRSPTRSMPTRKMCFMRCAIWRAMISGLTAILQNPSRGMGEVKPDLISYRASDLVEDLRKKVAHEFPNESSEITWEVETGEAMLNVDPQLLEQAFSEVFTNAFQH